MRSAWSLERRTEAAILDFDGVVANVDIERAITAALPYAECFALPPRQILNDFFYHNPRNRDLDLGLVTAEAVRTAMRPQLWRGRPDDWLAWWEAVENAYQISVTMCELLDELGSRCRLGLVTDNHLGFRSWLKTRPDIGRYFDVVVCSAEIGVKKPARMIYQIAANQLGASLHNAIYLDDDSENVRAAQLLGIPSIHFESVTQARSELTKIIGV